MSELNDFFATLSGYLRGWPTIVLLLGTHIYLTVRLRFPQRHILKALKLSITPDKGSSGDVSQFGALATALAATIGTGNIVGVATAVALGGPGSVLWCWLTGVFGMATKYGESLLAVKYRVRTPEGKMAGGPMYALEKGLGWKRLAILFALFYRDCFAGHWQHRASQRHCRIGRENLFRVALHHRLDSGCAHRRGDCGRREQYRQSV